MKRWFLYLFFSFLCITWKVNGQTLKSCDLIFHVEGESDFSSAITSSTSREDSISFVHVGIIMIDEKGHVKVIEASPSEGVRSVSLEDFLKEAPLIDEKPGAVVKRLTIPFSVSSVIEIAVSFMGQPYDWWYMPDNGKMYCSELIYESFVDEKGEKIFKPQPMNFRSKDGSLPNFWVKLFSELGEEVPEGVLGSNPNDLSRDKRLIEVIRYF